MTSLLSLIENPDSRVRKAAGSLLVALGPNSGDAAAALANIAANRSRPEEIRLEIVQVLGQMGAAAAARARLADGSVAVRNR